MGLHYSSDTVARIMARMMKLAFTPSSYQTNANLERNMIFVSFTYAYSGPLTKVNKFVTERQADLEKNGIEATLKLNVYPDVDRGKGSNQWRGYLTAEIKDIDGLEAELQQEWAKSVAAALSPKPTVVDVTHDGGAMVPTKKG